MVLPVVAGTVSVIVIVIVIMLGTSPKKVGAVAVVLIAHVLANIGLGIAADLTEASVIEAPPAMPHTGHHTPPRNTAPHAQHATHSTLS